MELVFATNNLNKLKEVKAQLPESIKILSLAEIGCTIDIPETSNTIEGNALQKAIFIKEKFGYDCFADDTGLEVDFLNGAPGVYSARYAGEQKDANDNMHKLLENLKGSSNRKARFKTVISLLINNEVYSFTGICNGTITTKKSGSKGFGYDPIFMPEGYDLTFAEMDLKLKNQIGHRGKAVQQLIIYLKTQS